MSFVDAFRYDGKRALVVGGATGMGAATAELVQGVGNCGLFVAHWNDHRDGLVADTRLFEG